jgi:hypothetical protein
LSIPHIKFLKRIYLLAFLFGSLLIFNTLRIVVLSMVSKVDLFDEIHLFLWYFVSTIFVVLLWFLAVKLFNIKSIPFYSDLER